MKREEIAVSIIATIIAIVVLSFLYFNYDSEPKGDLTFVNGPKCNCWCKVTENGISRP